MIWDVYEAVLSLTWWEAMLLSSCAIVLASGICGVLGMGDDF